MISSVFLSGRIGEIIAPKMRNVEIDRVVTSPQGTGSYEICRVPVRAQCLETNRFLTVPVGSYICLKGRIEMDEEFGLIIVSELDEIYESMPGDAKPRKSSHPAKS